MAKDKEQYGYTVQKQEQKMEIKQIEQRIVSLLANLYATMPDVLTLKFSGQVYSSFLSGGVDYSIEGHKSLWIGNYENLAEHFFDEESRIMELMRELSLSDKVDWNHFKYSLSRNGNFKVETCYIAEGDSWSKIYLKGISELTREEAKEKYISLED